MTYTIYLTLAATFLGCQIDADAIGVVSSSASSPTLQLATPPAPTRPTPPAPIRPTLPPPPSKEDKSTTPWTPNPLCPYPSEEPVFHPDPYDCTKYYECFEGNLYVMLCPNNLVWNDKQKACDYPENTDCSTISSSSSPPASSSSSPSPTLPTPTQADDSTTPWTSNPLCPYPSDEIIFHPDPYDCAKYYECFEGNLYVMLCPENLVWNDKQKACDYPEDTDCSTISSSSLPPVSSTSISPTVPTPSQDYTTTPWTPNPLCPYPSDEMIFHPDPYDCSKYYECFEGNLYIMLCPDNLIWNDKIQACDYPENTDCSTNKIF